MKNEPAILVKEKDQHKESFKEVKAEEIKEEKEKPTKTIKASFYSINYSRAVNSCRNNCLSKNIQTETLEKLRASGERISVAVMPFQNMTNDTTKGFLAGRDPG